MIHQFKEEHKSPPMSQEFSTFSKRDNFFQGYKGYSENVQQKSNILSSRNSQTNCQLINFADFADQVDDDLNIKLSKIDLDILGYTELKLKYSDKIKVIERKCYF